VKLIFVSEINKSETFRLDFFIYFGFFYLLEFLSAEPFLIIVHDELMIQKSR